MKSKKIFILIIGLVFALNIQAGDGDVSFNVAGGWQFDKTFNAVIALEKEIKYHNSYELYFDLANAYTFAPDGKIYSNTFWKYPSILGGLAYKPTLLRGKNTSLKMRGGAALGVNKNGFECGIDLGLEYSYSFKNRWKIFVWQKNDVVFWTRDHWRTGILIGVKIPIN
ncbi:hypothetical protein FACS189451_03810 [Bacteroidia bacterium]|nr:hypothetical protein FACS189446_1610 [Bacteroidia bacterium]GHT61554.1 hypothetical protein FACS189451_03810 [Bacteroidia bacterium]